MSSRLALIEISQAFVIPNLEGLLNKCGARITGFLAALTYSYPGVSLENTPEFLQIVVPSVHQGLIFLGVLMANGYEINMMPLDSKLGVPWPAESTIAYRHSVSAKYVVIKTLAQVSATAVNAENFSLPCAENNKDLHGRTVFGGTVLGGTVLGGTVPSIQVLGGTVPSIQILGGTVPSIQVPSSQILLGHRMTWLTKPEDELTEDDQDIINKYNDAGFIIFTQEPKQLTAERRQIPLVGQITESHIPRRRLNALSPHADVAEPASAFSTMISAVATIAGISPPLNKLPLRRQKAMPSTSDGSEDGLRRRSASELSDYHDCVPPDSIPRIFFGSRE